MNQDTKKKLLLYNDHKRPTTRRDFLSQGFIGLAAYTVIPSFLGTMSWSAWARAAQCEVPDNGYSPFLVFDMAGGGGLPGNFLVGNKNGPEDLLTSYSLLGWDPRRMVIDRRFGLPMAGANVSKIFEGMTTTMSPEAQALTQMGSICHQSQDDSSINTTSALIEVAKAGLQGNLIKNGLGMSSGDSGGNTGTPLKEPTLKPLEVASVDSVTGATGYEMLQTELSTSGVAALAKANLAYSREQIRNFENLPNGQQLKELAECGYVKNSDIITKGGSVDPRQSQIFQQVFGINTQTASNNQNAIVATIALNTLMKNTGPGCLRIGGCDYHDGTQTTGDQKDLETGQMIGRSIEAAHRLKKPLVFQLLTDGGVYAREGTRMWQGDGGDKSMTVIGSYNPTRKPTMRRLQLGNYTNGQGADRDVFFGGNTSLVAYAVFANYLQTMGRLSDFEKFVAPDQFPRERLDDVLLFG